MIGSAERRRLSVDPDLGAGNFLQRIRSLGRPLDTPVLWFEPEFRLPGGRVRSALTLGELCEVVDTYAGWYHGREVRPRDPVVVYCDSAIELIVHYLALTGLGAIPVLVNGELPAELARAYTAPLGAVGVFTDEAHRSILTGGETARFAATSADVTPTDRDRLPGHYPFRHDAADPVVITHSSGTTGLPKAVLHNHQSLFHATRYRLSLPVPQAGERILSALPGAHNSALSVLMFALLNDLPVKILSSQRAGVALRAVEEFRPTGVCAFSVTYAEIAAAADLDRYDLSSVSVWYNSGDAAHESHIKVILGLGQHVEVAADGTRTIVPGSSFLDGLGSSEMGHSLFYLLHRPGEAAPSRCVGRPYAFVEAAVLDDNGDPLPPMSIGRLGVKSPTITPGYWNDSLTTYRSRLRGYWLTGDLAYRDHGGHFYHVDRVTDAVRTRHGTLHTVQAEELVLRQLPEVADCTVVGVDLPGREPQVYALLQLVPEAGQAAEEMDWTKRVNEVLREHHLPAVATALPITENDLAVGPTGKVKKRELRERYRDLAERGEQW
ncbi:class I adenylate-forming enzyme family protein [Micromonospora sp. KC721]|uniref:class I adenylate-forming enzyme family protein n=1 Tax=Micromonospora sp. KC721 TaxID=2530380 RepID=UPI001A9FED3E|nr:class I adenylate-forming enzyme family protein [Micromonospora sp. KC721]